MMTPYDMIIIFSTVSIIASVPQTPPTNQPTPNRNTAPQVAVKQKLDQFKAADYTFADARECKFVEKLCEVRGVAGVWRCVSGVCVYVSGVPMYVYL